MVHAVVDYLLPPRSASQSSAAIKPLYFIFAVQNQTWPSDAVLKTYADEQVLATAPAMVRSGSVEVLHELALYLGSMSSARAHEYLLQIADRPDDAGEQARICLTWHPNASDLPSWQRY